MIAHLPDDAPLFEGVSINGDFSEALRNAIAEAKRQLITDLVSWRLSGVTGVNGGFVGQTDLTVSVYALPAGGGVDDLLSGGRPTGQGGNVTPLADRQVVEIVLSNTAPQAGSDFTIRVRLNQQAPRGGTEVRFNTQRLIPDPGGYVVTSPTGDRYFDVNELQPVTIPQGQILSPTRRLRVKRDATYNGVRIVFPDELLITAYVGSLDEGFHCGVARVRPG